ncbi:MAG: hypothetical protein VXZ82_05905 [Planctomycetota bacterium]|nr:hypothetical protein [Planctomycetota bacterium]
MSNSPFETETQIDDNYGDGVQRVSVRPFQLLSEGWVLVQPQYWLMLGVLLTASFLSGIVPLGIIAGPLMVGVYFCFIDLESGRAVQFNRLFQGFDRFTESFVAFLIMVGATLLVYAVTAVVFVLAFVVGATGGEEALPAVFILVAGGALLLTFLMLFIHLPFLFCFQLIADRGVDGLESVKLSFKGAWRNSLGILWFSIVIWFISVLSLLLCGLPMILMMPIFVGAFFTLYRQIYGIPMAAPI